MQQQVNFAKYIILPIKSFLDAKRLLTLYGILFLVLMFFYLCLLLLKSYQLIEHNKVKQQLDSTRQQLLLTAAKYPQSSGSQKLLDPRQFPSCNIKFSTYLAGLAKAATPGVWLTDIVISNKGKEINLKGLAMKAAEAQQYVIQLKKLAEFRTLSFELKELSQTPDSTDSIQTIIQPLHFQLTAKATN